MPAFAANTVEQWDCYESDNGVKEPRDSENVLFVLQLAGEEANVVMDNIWNRSAYSLEGLNRFWSWGVSEDTDVFLYVIKLTPTGAAYYYDFTDVGDDEMTKPTEAYSCEKDARTR